MLSTLQGTTPADCGVVPPVIAGPFTVSHERATKQYGLFLHLTVLDHWIARKTVSTSILATRGSVVLAS